MKIRKLREALYQQAPGLATQEGLARAVGVTAGTISSWERGKTRPSKRLRKRLARVLGCEPDDLLGDDDQAEDQ